MTATEQPNNDPRVYFAAERTLLAWIRTGLALMGFGFVVARFGLFLQQLALLQKVLPPPATGASRWFGTGLVVSGVVITIGAMASHVTTVQRLKRGEPYVGQVTWPGLVTAAFLSAGGL